MSRHTTVGVMALGAGLIIFWDADGLSSFFLQSNSTYAFASLLFFFSGFCIGGGVGLKQGRLEK